MADIGSAAEAGTTTLAPLGDLPVVDVPFLDGTSGAGLHSTTDHLEVVEPLGPTLTAAIDDLGSDAASATDVVMAAFCAVLHRYNRSTHLVVGLQQDEGLAPLIIDGRDSPSAIEWISRTVGAAEAARSEGDPSMLEADLPSASGASHLTRCVLTPTATQAATIVHSAQAVLTMNRTGAGIHLVLRVAAASGNKVAAERFLTHVIVMLNEFVEDPTRPMAAMRLVSDEERALLTAWNTTSRPYRPGLTLVSLFDEQVARTPDSVALVGPTSETLTYRRLDERVTTVANWLAANGVGPESLIGLLMDRSIEMVVGMYGILRAGGAYVPLDPDYPADRLAFMADEAELGVILTQDHLSQVVPVGDRKVLALDTQWSEAEAAPANDPVAVSEDSAAYVLYTSGSTGRPKGVVNTHRGIVNRLLWMQDHFGLEASDCVLQKTAFSFDVSVWEFFWPLQTGARLVLAAPGGHRDPAYLERIITDQKVTTLHFVPSMLRLYLEAAKGRGDERGTSTTTVKRVVCSGEALTADLRDRFFRRFPSAELHNLYGPTEAAVDVTSWRCDPSDRSAVVPIGTPVANTQIHLLDGNLQVVPIGVAGELCIGGTQVARGYLKRPELTAERFVDDPFSEGGRLYRTGDLARWSPDGHLEFLGRTDDQVKVRGNRIELGEIDAVLLRHPKIAGAATTVHQRGQRLQLAAHYTVVDTETVAPAELRAFLGGKLPAYMVPNALIEHEALAVTTSGKIDRRALDAAFEDRAAPSDDLVGPRNDLERFLAELWAETLGLDRVGVNDRFFELGGDSLQAAELVNRIQDDLGAFIYVVTMFTSPTIAEYAAMLRRDYGEAVTARFGDATPGGDETGRPVEDSGPRSLDEKLSLLRAAVPTFGPFDGWRAEPLNPRAVFVLSPPRSGTSLLRVMLAGHPGLFAGSELQLLHFDSLQERRGAFTGRFKLWREGTIRSLMELDGLDAVEATAAMDAYDGENLTVKAFTGLLQQRIEPRVLVDKSPSYALDRAALDNAEAGFREPFYIHLLRHPHEMVHSFVDYHLDQVLFLHDHALTPIELAEAVWVESHRTTLDFLAGIPSDRQHQVRFEDLVGNPRPTMERLAGAIGLPFEEALVDPYHDLEHKMVDGLHDSSTPMGDTRLLGHGAINPDVIDQWRKREPDDILDRETWTLADQFGYVRPEKRRSETGRRRQRAAARQRQRRQGRS